MSAGRGVEELLPEVTADRLDTYETLLAALAEAVVRMPLWEGAVGDPTARYGGLDVAGHPYAPAFTSDAALADSGWPREADSVPVPALATALSRARWGLWLNPHAPEGGLGIPWPDLRRIATGLDRLPAGPLRLGDAGVAADDFYQLLVAEARRTPPLRALWRAWVRPAVGTPYLVIGLDVDGTAESDVSAVRRMMRRAVRAAPEGLAVGSVTMADADDPVALWLRAHTRPFYERGAAAPAGAAGGPPGGSVLPSGAPAAPGSPLPGTTPAAPPRGYRGPHTG